MDDNDVVNNDDDAQTYNLTVCSECTHKPTAV